MGQQAAQQAAASASRAAQQQANQNYQQTIRHASSLNHRHSPRPSGRRQRGLFGRLISLVFTLVTLVVAAGVFLLILSQAQPGWFNSLS